MAHGTHCHCMICAVGKKMGMIHEEHYDEHAKDEHGHNHNDHHETCEHCGHVHKEDSHCNCGCQ